MAIGLVVYDLLYLTLAALLYGGAGWAGIRVHAALLPMVPFAVAAALGAVCSLFALVALAGFFTALCPRLVPGSYEMMKGRVFFGWIFRSLVRRVLFVPGLKWILFSSNVLRFLSLRALGCRVAFTSSLSADADLLDPSLTILEPGAIVGARCILTGHFVQEGKLLLGEVRIGKRALLAGDVGCMPGVTVGAKALVKSRVSLSIGTVVGEGASVGAASGIDAYAQIGAGARVGNMCYVGVRAQVPDGAEVASGTRFG